MKRRNIEANIGDAVPRTLAQQNAGDEYLHCSLNIVNNDDDPKLCQVNQQLLNPILTNAKEYFCSCVRFNLDGSTIPIFIFPPDVVGGLPEVQPFNVTLVGVFGFQSTVQVTYNALDSTNGQRTVYSYQSFIDSINIALNTAFGGLNAANKGTTTEAPYMTYDVGQGLFKMIAQVDYDDAATGPRIYMNSRLYGFFNNFLTQADHTNDKELEYQIIIQNLQGNNVKPGAPQNYYVMTQEFPNFASWFDLTSIVFISNTLGIRNEIAPIANSTIGSLVNNAQGMPPTLPIMNDFAPYLPYNDASGARGYIYYSPSAEYKLMNLEKDVLNQIDLSVKWRDRVGNLYDYYIPPFQSLQVKLMFRKRTPPFSHWKDVS